MRVGDLSAAQSAVEEAQVAARTDVDRAAALALLGQITDGLGDYVKTQTILAEAVPLARSSGDRLTLCRALDVLGLVNLHVGKFEEARLALEESLALACELGDVPRELRALDRLGVVADFQGDLTGAERLFSEVHTRAVAAGNREWEMNALEGLGVIADERGDFARAQEHGRRSLAIAREIGAQAIVAIGLISQADGDIRLGDTATARLELREGLALAQRLGILPYMVLAVTNFGKLAYAEGKTEQALGLFGLVHRQPAFRADLQREMDLTLAKWELNPSMVEAGMAKGAELDWDKTIEELLKGETT